ncbi:hypothetical protein EIN_318800 [Entamoeba invadens IP1]|uniref:Uncharacterized protein n=1 Tax=Entamoeba invadens IP1 TaxID=370355 RepID=A0A0A1U5G4_ENTIV|nr:hypothetical protein EIN_318800 [Entamoeba invadens IP1]ELP87011.1 hypothetical protein EIN_318800 [Entamoeba invadens IP1]|eukprot:XP_004253782.1 hypothetical protein EIN_318800 [Entamoeba invadens IP1]
MDQTRKDVARPVLRMVSPPKTSAKTQPKAAKLFLPHQPIERHQAPTKSLEPMVHPFADKRIPESNLVLQGAQRPKERRSKSRSMRLASIPIYTMSKLDRKDKKKVKKMDVPINWSKSDIAKQSMMFVLKTNHPSSLTAANNKKPRPPHSLNMKMLLHLPPQTKQQQPKAMECVM